MFNAVVIAMTSFYPLFEWPTFFWVPFAPVCNMQQNFKLPQRKTKKPAKTVKSDSDHFRHFTFHDEGRKKRQKQNED